MWYRWRVRLWGKTVERVGGLQMKGMGAEDLVRELLEAKGGLGFPLGPQQRALFSEGGSPKLFAGNRRSKLRDDIADHAGKARRVRPAIHHEFRQSLGRVEG